MREELKNQWIRLATKGNSLQKAISWVKRYRIPNSGIVAHHKTKNVTQEVTGYLITSLYNAGEKDLSFDLAKWEASVQRPDGAFVGPGTDIPYTFDTAQVARGFLTVVDELPQIKDSLIKACDFLVSQIDAQGQVHTPNADLWALADGTQLSEYCNLYCLSPLSDTGKKYGIISYTETALRALNYYKNKKDLVEFKSQLGTLSHIFGYMMEALVDLGEYELAQKGLEQALRIQKKNGAIPAYPGVEWICSTGMAQLGIAWYKIGNQQQAKSVLAYLEKIQNSSGGFFGSYGAGARYFPKEEISWANKYFIDLYLLVRGKNG